MSFDTLRPLVTRWREGPGATYRTLFLWEERIKNFRFIRRGIQQVVREIEAGTFGNVHKGSSLETVVGSIAEQRQMFKGADHAFLWKPKLRIPDIYENRENQLAFARFLHTCACCTGPDQIVAAIRRLDAHAIKGLGPAAANLLCFLHPTLVPPFNTAIVNGYNALTGARVKLGRWEEYLAMRNGVLALNAEFRDLLSNDFGAVAGLMFDVGSGRYPAPPRGDDAAARSAWLSDLAAVREAGAKADKAAAAARESDRTHTEIQGWLRDLGRSLGYAVWIAANDRNRPCGTGRLGDGCLAALPPEVERAPGADAVRLIDVLWWTRRRDEWRRRSRSSTPPPSTRASCVCWISPWARPTARRTASSWSPPTGGRKKCGRSCAGQRSAGSPTSRCATFPTESWSGTGKRWRASVRA